MSTTSATAAPFGFPGEQFLAQVPPNYPLERLVLSAALILATFFWLVVFPHWTETYLYKRGEHISSSTTAEIAATNGKSGRHTVSNGKNRGEKRDPKALNHATSTSPSSSLVQDSPAAEIHFEVLALSAILSILSVAGIILLSSNNTYVSRRVFQAPLLTSEECQYVIDMAHRAGDRNHENAILQASSDPRNTTIQDFLKAPHGWHKTRHNNYPTTDLNLVNDPFLEEDREYIQERLDARLAPLLERVFGVSRSAIRANDMFVVRYDATDRPFLATHTDDGDISINILLSQDFEGGGTQFWNRLTQAPFAHIQPASVGQLVAHSAQIHHEGMAVTSGTRYILVGFLALDRVSPVSQEATNLSWFASYFSLPYLHKKFKEGYTATWDRRREGLRSRWSDNKYVHAMFGDLVNFLEWVGDVQSKHEHVNLVEDERQAYLDSLDRDFQARGGNLPEASWFQGQQLNLDFDGTVASAWKTRRQEL